MVKKEMFGKLKRSFALATHPDKVKHEKLNQEFIESFKLIENIEISCLKPEHIENIQKENQKIKGGNNKKKFDYSKGIATQSLTEFLLVKIMTHFLIITNTAELDKNKQIFKENFTLKPKLVKLTNNNILNNKIQLLNAEILLLCAIVNDITVKLNGPFNEKTDCTDIKYPTNKNINDFSKSCALARIEEFYNDYEGYIDSKNIPPYNCTDIDAASYRMIRNIVKNNYSSLIFKKKDLTKLQSKIEIGNNKSKFVISNSANFTTDWYAPYLYCPIVSTFDSMTTCGYDTQDYFSVRNGMNLKIQTRDDKISYFVQFLKNENQPNHYSFEAILSYNNEEYKFDEGLNISNPLSRFDAKNAFHKLVINMHNVYKDSPEKIQNIKGSSLIYTKYTEFFDICKTTMFTQAFYKSIGDWGQEIHVLSKNGGFIPDKNNEIQNIRGFDNAGDFIRIGIAKDRPSASRMMFMCLFADNINNDVIVGYQADDTSKRFAPNTGDYTTKTKDLLISRKPFFPDEDTGHYTDYEDTDYEETDMEDNDSISIQDDNIDITKDIDNSMDIDSQEGITDVDSDVEYIKPPPPRNKTQKKAFKANRQTKKKLPINKTDTKIKPLEVRKDINWYIQNLKNEGVRLQLNDIQNIKSDQNFDTDLDTAIYLYNYITTDTPAANRDEKVNNNNKMIEKLRKSQEDKEKVENHKRESEDTSLYLPPVQNINNKPPQPPVQNINNKPLQPSNKTIKKAIEPIKANSRVLTKKKLPINKTDKQIKPLEVRKDVNWYIQSLKNKCVHLQLSDIKNLKKYSKFNGTEIDMAKQLYHDVTETGTEEDIEVNYINEQVERLREIQRLEERIRMREARKQNDMKQPEKRKRESDDTLWVYGDENSMTGRTFGNKIIRHAGKNTLKQKKGSKKIMHKSTKLTRKRKGYKKKARKQKEKN